MTRVYTCMFRVVNLARDHYKHNDIGFGLGFKDNLSQRCSVLDALLFFQNRASESKNTFVVNTAYVIVVFLLLR